MYQKHSLSWFKKRTAALNKAMGTKYSAAQLYRHQNSAEFSTIRGVLEDMGDPRSSGASTRISTAQGRLNDTTWAAFAGRDAFAHAVLGAQGSGLISPTRRNVYQQDARGQWFSIGTRSGSIKPIKEPPKGVIPLTPAEVNKQLTLRAKEVKKHRERHPLDAYPPVA